MQDVGRHDAGMQRRAEGVETGEREFAVDHRLMGETAAGAAVFFRHRRAQKTGFTGLGPHLAVVHAGRVPAVDVGDEFIGDEAPRLLFEQDQVLGHPGRARQIDGSHGGAWPIGSRDSTYTPGVRQARGAASYPAPSATATL